MFWDNISAEGQSVSRIRENVGNRKYFFPLQFLIILYLPNTDADLPTLKGQAYYLLLYIHDMYYGIQLKGCNRDFYHDPASA